MRLKVEQMRKGDLFTDAHGLRWMFLRSDGGASGAYHCQREDGHVSVFAGCAEFEVTRPEFADWPATEDAYGQELDRGTWCEECRAARGRS